MAKWVESLRGLEDFQKSLSPKLRHGRKHVAVSAIAAQMYCEQHVEMRLRMGNIDTSAKAKGRSLHDEIIPTKEAALDDIIKGIQSGNYYSCIFPLFGKVEGLPLIGVPDSILFFCRAPLSVIELKTTRKERRVLWPNERVQLQTYGLLLREMGFNTKLLYLALAKVWDDTARSTSLAAVKTWILDTLMATCPDHAEKDLGNGYLSLFTFDHKKALKDLQWAKGYWTSEREPIPTKKPEKCRACEYNEMCDRRCT